MEMESIVLESEQIQIMQKLFLNLLGNIYICEFKILCHSYAKI